MMETKTMARVKALQAKKAIYLEMLLSAVAGERLYSADYKEMKEQFGRIIESEFDEVIDLYNQGDIDLIKIKADIWTAPTLFYMGAALKKYNKLIAGGAVIENKAMITWLLYWYDVHLKVEVIKADVRKVRKPVLPLKAARTLENTGTCPVCSQNVKLGLGEIVRHGYRVHWSQLIGCCPGTGFKPWEVSAEGAKWHVRALEAQCVENLRLAAGVESATSFPGLSTTYRGQKGGVIITEDHPHFADAKKQYTRSLESDYKNLIRDIKYFADRVAEWTAQPLPGAKK